MPVVLSALVMFLVVGVALSVLIYLPTLAVVESIPPRRARARAAVWLCALCSPVLASGAATVGGLWQVLHDKYGSPHLTAERPHLCTRWVLDAPDVGWSLAVVALVAGGLLAFAVVRVVQGLLRSELAARRLRRQWHQAAGTEASDVVGVDASGPLAVTVGAWRPVVLATSGLRSLLSEEEWRAVVAHEQAHVRARDNIWSALAAAATDALALSPTAQLYARCFREAVEIACDQLAARATSPEVVAAAMQRLVDSSGERQRGSIAGVSDHWTRSAAQVERRVQELAAAAGDPAPQRRASPLPALAGALGAGAVMAGLWWATGRQVNDTLYCLGESLLAVVGRW